MPKVILTSNFADDTVAEILVKENLTQEQAESLCKEEQNKCGDNSRYWPQVKSDDYRLWRGMSDLVGE